MILSLMVSLLVVLKWNDTSKMVLPILRTIEGGGASGAGGALPHSGAVGSGCDNGLSCAPLDLGNMEMEQGQLSALLLVGHALHQGDNFRQGKDLLHQQTKGRLAHAAHLRGHALYISPTDNILSSVSVRAITWTPFPSMTIWKMRRTTAAASSSTIRCCLSCGSRR